MAASLAEIRAKLKEAEARRSGEGTRSNYDKSIYPFWQLNNGANATVRFLPDGDETNSYFWVEKQMIRLPFSGIKGGDEHKTVWVAIPCVEMYNDKSICPIISEVRPWWNDKSLADLARKYWKKRSYILHGFVVNDGLKESDPPENPIRKFNCTPQVHKIIQAILLDDELEEFPTDYTFGLDFKIDKKTVGEWADYALSSWSRKTRQLSDVERQYLATYELPHLKDLLPPKPTAEDLVHFKEMFEVSVDGGLFDQALWPKWNAYANNRNVDDSSATTTTTISVPKPAEAVVRDPEPSAAPVSETESTETATVAPTSRVNDILAQIRNRNS